MVVENKVKYSDVKVDDTFVKVKFDNEWNLTDVDVEDMPITISSSYSAKVVGAMTHCDEKYIYGRIYYECLEDMSNYDSISISWRDKYDRK